MLAFIRCIYFINASHENADLVGVFNFPAAFRTAFFNVILPRKITLCQPMKPQKAEKLLFLNCNNKLNGQVMQLR